MSTVENSFVNKESYSGIATENSVVTQKVKRKPKSVKNLSATEELCYADTPAIEKSRLETSSRPANIKSDRESLQLEVDLHQHVTNCKKNPGHPEFIPIESFSLKHLPEGHQDGEIYELIKAVADLSVRISVTMTSPERIECWPNTRIPYFLSELRGKKTLRTATGFVVDVYKDIGRQCPCDKCKASDKPSTTFWGLWVTTARHVVFDDIEANHATLRVFYDSEDSELVILKDKLSIVYTNTEADFCQFQCVTCDENLGNKLLNMWKIFYDLWYKVHDKHRKTRDNDKLAIIVSHPHACSKQVSVGCWKDMVKVDDNKSKVAYTTCTCPGSSGATVVLLGYGNEWWDQLVHCGSLKSGLNYSGHGEVWCEEIGNDLTASSS